MKNVIYYIFWPVLAGLVFAAVVLAVPQLSEKFSTSTEEQVAPQVISQAQNLPFSFSHAISNAAPAVVSINSTQIMNSPDRVRFFPELRLVTPDYFQENSLGSGVIISPDGFIITSYHIFYTPGTNTIETENTITLRDGRTLDARLIALDERNDLALLKVDEEDLPYLSIGPSRALEVGDVVLAIGNPRNIGQAVSLGIISALLGRGNSFVIQTDAAINPGNSGGALIDYNGDLIGINSMIVSESGGSEGIGFATPADKAIRLMNAYIESGPIAYLGVESQLIALRSFNMSLGGFLVESVSEDSPAEHAGILPGDILTQINDIGVEIGEEGDNFIDVLTNISPGESADIKVFRDGEFLTLPTVIGETERTYYQIPPEEGEVIPQL